MKTSALVISAMRIAASVEPTTVPTPPRMLTPPTTEAVMTVSSRPGGVVDWMTRNCVANSERRDAGEEAVQREHHDTVRCGETPHEPRRLGVAAGRVDRATRAANSASTARRAIVATTMITTGIGMTPNMLDVGEMEVVAAGR